jgi:hypothetical protein
MKINFVKIYISIKKTTQYLLSFLGTIDFPWCYYTLYKGQLYKRLIYKQSYFDYLDIDDTNLLSESLVIYKRCSGKKIDITELTCWYPEFGQSFFLLETWQQAFGLFDSIITVNTRKHQIEYNDKTIRL